MQTVKPQRSYVVWHTQRTGSTLLCTTLAATGIAGRPDEWPERTLRDAPADAEQIRDALWRQQTTANGVLGVKWSYHQPSVDDFWQVFGTRRPGGAACSAAAWARVFPNCRHLLMKRRDRLRQAVSWWKMIAGGPGHFSHDGSPLPWQTQAPIIPPDLGEAYDFDAIKALMSEISHREEALAAMLSALEAAPLVVFYEDLAISYQETVSGVLSFLELAQPASEIPAPLLATTSDRINDAWVKRFEAEAEARFRG